MQIVLRKDGPIIQVQGVEKQELTAQQLKEVEQRVREELMKGNCDRLLTTD